MRNVGEKIVYGGVGLMEIVDVREECFAGISHKYYVMTELRSTSASQTFVPVDNKKLCAAMYPILTKEEALALISRIGSIPFLEWNNDNRIRAAEFKAVIESGNREKILSLIKTLSEKSKQRREEGKKNSLADESTLKKAERLLYSELAEVLGITEPEVSDIVTAKL